MPSWPAYFVVIIAIAFALQTAILAAVYFQTKKSHEQIMRIATDLHARIAPVISRVELLVGETQPRIVSMVNDASEVVHMARNQAQKVDRVLTEALDRIRIQLLTTDRILTGVLETVEDAGSTVKHTVMGPIQQATAVIRGIKTGIDVLRSFRRPRDGASATTPSEPSDEGLFI
jgi:uncharacterized membrane protein